MNITNENWLHKLFVDEAKAAKNYHNRGGSGGSDGTGNDSIVVDCSEFPTKNINDSKIYRISKTEESTYVWVVMSQAGLNGELGTLLGGSCNYVIVDELPSVFEPLPTVYIVRNEWIPYASQNGTSISNLANLLGLSDKGLIDDPSKAVDDGVYTVISSTSSLSYGLPNADEFKDIYEYGPNGNWNQINKQIADVTALPTENVDQSKIYRTAETVNEDVYEIYIRFSDDLASQLASYGLTNPCDSKVYWEKVASMRGISECTYEYHIVDALPEVGEVSSMITSSPKSLTVHNYIIASDPTSEAYIYENNAWKPVSQSTFKQGSFNGTITSLDEATAEGYYIFKTIAEITATVYGIPNGDNTKRIYEYGDEWFNVGDEISSLTSENSLLSRDKAELTTAIETLEAEVVPLRQKVIDDAPYANFGRYAQWGTAYCEKYNTTSETFDTYNGTLVHGWKETSIETVDIPAIVNILYKEAFAYCGNLKSITLKEGLYKIDTRAFINCTSLSSIDIPYTVTYIGMDAFYGGVLTEVILPTHLYYIGSEAFYKCANLKTITFRGFLVTHIQDNAFKSCSALERINYAGTKAQWKAITFGTDWDAETGNYTVYCTDGTIAKDGTET